MTTLGSLIAVGVACVCVPFVVYLSAKLWAYGYRRGMQLYYRDYPKEKKERGDD